MNTITIRPFAAMKLLTLAVLALVLLLLNGCHWVGEKGNGKLTTDTRSVTDFTRMEVDGAFTINWTRGPAALRITTDENLMQYIRTELNGDRLRIEWIKPLKGTRGIKIEAASPHADEDDVEWRGPLYGRGSFRDGILPGSEWRLPREVERNRQRHVRRDERREPAGCGKARHPRDGAHDQRRRTRGSECVGSVESGNFRRRQSDLSRQPEGLAGDQRRGESAEARVDFSDSLSRRVVPILES